MEEALTQLINLLVENGLLPEEGAQEVYENLLQSEFLDTFVDPETGLFLSNIFNEIAFITDSLNILSPLFVTQDRLFDVQHLAELEEKLLLDDTIELMFDPAEPTVLSVNHTDTIKINYNIDFSEGLGISFAINAINKALARERYQFEVGELFDNGMDFMIYAVMPVGEKEKVISALTPFFAEGEITHYQELIESDLNPNIVF